MIETRSPRCSAWSDHRARRLDVDHQAELTAAMANAGGIGFMTALTSATHAEGLQTEIRSPRR